MPGKDTVDSTTPPIVTEKLAAFERLLPEFETSFHFVQEMHGQKRFQQLAVADIARYLHALWVCECKDRLLSVPRTVHRYEGQHALELLEGWQQGEVAQVVAFLQARLDLMPFADITAQWQAAVQAGDEPRATRLQHGRLNLLNRGFNLHAALDAIFALSLPELLEQARAAGEQLGHAPARIGQQIAEMATAPYLYYPHPDLARRNMLVMNALGVRVTDNRADQPGNRTWKVEDTSLPATPYAQTLIAGALELLPAPHGTYAYFPETDAAEVVLNRPVEPYITQWTPAT